MEIKIISDIENHLFNRREIEGDIHTNVTPSREDVRQVLAEKFSTSTDTIKIRTIKGKFGSKVFLIVANIYKSKEDKDKIELKKKKDVEFEKKQVEEPTPSAEPKEDSSLTNQDNSKSQSETNKEEIK